ncbi:LPXTG cell wall anchor domain-containing protein [Listeria monocytogenes]|nr:LPXTG cell wall anchor domain-containing protein [Listeria monocytogenes]
MKGAKDFLVWGLTVLLILTMLPLESMAETVDNPSNKSEKVVNDNREEFTPSDNAASQDIGLEVDGKAEYNKPTERTMKVNQSNEKSTEMLDDWMPDKELQNTIASRLNIDVTQLTKEVLEKRVSYLLIGDGVTSLDGLEYAKNLTYLDISDASRIPEENLKKVLEQLPKLRRIDIDNLASLTWISNLTQLEHLSVVNTGRENKIRSLEPLKNLVNLEYLEVHSNEIVDLSPLSNLKKLHSFGAEENPYSDITPLHDLKGLEYIDISNTKVADVSVMENFNKLMYAVMEGCRIYDLSPVKGEYISANNQKVVRPLIYPYKEVPYKINNFVRLNETGTIRLIPQSSSSWQGEYADENESLTWLLIDETNTPKKGELIATWSEHKDNDKVQFSGTLIQPYVINQTSIEAHNTTLYTGDTWNAKDNFDKATDRDGNSVTFQDIQVTGQVNTKKAGKYPVIYRYDGVEKEIEVTVLPQKAASNSGQSTNSEGNPNILTKNEVSSSTNGYETINIGLPKTGDRDNVLLILLGTLCISAFLLIWFRRKQIK